MIAIGLSPNTEKDDILQALKALLQPWKWKKGDAVYQVENWFRTYLNNNHVVAVNSGRSAMYLILKSFSIHGGDEVIVQAFTCLAVPEVVSWCGAKPVFIDIDETLNMDTKLLERAISAKTRAIIVQHTFGVPANIEMIKKIAQKHNIILIEDCAHGLGAEFKGQKIGTWGDAAFFSFGRDKVISSVFGGLAILNSNSKYFKIASAKMDELSQKLNYPSMFWIIQQILHPLSFEFILPLYNLIIGKIILHLLQKFKLLSFPIYREEKKGLKPEIFPKLYPNALAILLLNQLKKIERLNNHRQELAKQYFQEFNNKKNIVLPQNIPGSIFLRFNILTDNVSEIKTEAKRSGILLGNWYHDVIDPEGSQNIVGYKLGDCPYAEKMARQSLNLPTNIRTDKNDISKIAKLIYEHSN